VLKVLFISTSIATIYLIRFQAPIKYTYDRSQDSFPHWKLVFVPSMLIASVLYLLNTNYYYFDPIEFLWNFSIILESAAMVPQLFIFYRFRYVESSTAVYIALMGAYRALYILNWIYRAHTERHYRHYWVQYFCGIIQTILYADFYGYYIKR
jgi:ER lumen protein retaining receptor